jgi:Uma2 family endonuclease
MAAVPVPVTEREIDDRRRLGIDKLDELWAGEWHLVNPPKYWHGWLNEALRDVLRPLAQARGLRAHGEGFGLFAAEDDWRVPDQIYARPEHVSDDGLVGAELVVEIRSPRDDSYRKLPFYASLGVAEVLILHEDRSVVLYRLGAGASLVPVPAGTDGSVRSDVLGVWFSTVDGPRLRITWDGGSAEA